MDHDALHDPAVRQKVPGRMRLVTIKLPKNPKHDPHNKVTGPCPVSGSCTDVTGEHHTVLIYTDSGLEKLTALHHITRVEEV